MGSSCDKPWCPLSPVLTLLLCHGLTVPSRRNQATRRDPQPWIVSAHTPWLSGKCTWLKHTQLLGLACFHVPGPDLHLACWCEYNLQVRHALRRPPARLTLEMVTCITSVVHSSLLSALPEAASFSPAEWDPGMNAQLYFHLSGAPIVICMARGPRAGLG